MIFLRYFFHFLGGVHLAIALIAMAALFVIAGTLIEAKTESHRFAALFTYSNPVFALILWGFFVNILFSALRRWPFRIKHIPFLLTHLGLLMLLGGTLIKNSYGIQGAMNLMEGSGSHSLLIPDTYGIYLERRDSDDPLKMEHTYYSLKKTMGGNFYTEYQQGTEFPDLDLSLLEYYPHSRSQLQSWFKGNSAFVNGLKPFFVYQLDEANSDPLPISTKVKFHHADSIPWNILAGKVDDITATSVNAYIEGMAVELSDPFTRINVFKGTLKEALTSPIILPDGSVTINLDFNFSVISGFQEPCLVLVRRYNGRAHSVHFSVALQGDQSLLTTSSEAGVLDVDLHRTPTILLLQDANEDLFYFAFDTHGQVYAESFLQDSLAPIIAYDQGFGGYAVQAKLPFPAYPNGRKEREEAILYHISLQLKQGLENGIELSPPLKLLQEACVKADVDFNLVCLDFLNQWHHSRKWLYPLSGAMQKNLSKALGQIDWNKISWHEKNSLFWMHILHEDFEKQLQPDQDLKAFLNQRGWPLLSSFDATSSNDNQMQFTALLQQIFAIREQLPAADFPKQLSETMHARLLSAYFQTYGIHLRNIMFPLTEKAFKDYLTAKELATQQDLEATEVVFEAPLTRQIDPEPTSIKLESNTPAITLKATQGSKAEYISLHYERSKNGLKWPIFNGKYLIRFQPEFREIPYHVRLRNARQINYALSTQPYSYESDLLITDLQSQAVAEQTISMNHVYETWDGYRFYLANIAPANEGAVKQVQIIVNYDPAKYWLTYPGAFILTMGILLLFWLKPYNTKGGDRNK